MTWQKVATVESETEPGKEYDIKRHPTTGALGCGCTSYRFSRGVKDCKHLRALRGAALPAKAVRPSVEPETVRVKSDGEMFTVRRAISFGRLTPEALR